MLFRSAVVSPLASFGFDSRPRLCARARALSSPRACFAFAGGNQPSWRSRRRSRAIGATLGAITRVNDRFARLDRASARGTRRARRWAVERARSRRRHERGRGDASTRRRAPWNRRCVDSEVPLKSRGARVGARVDGVARVSANEGERSSRDGTGRDATDGFGSSSLYSSNRKSKKLYTTNTHRK